jgi:polysaccharide export outer membrane protein
MQFRNIVLYFCVFFVSPLLADEANPAVTSQIPHDYRIVPGDVLEISVWREEGMESKVLVRPDGQISFPLVGNLPAGGRTVDEVRSELKSRLGEFLSSPEVTVQVLNSNQKVFVVGKVAKPGEIPMLNRISVLQALAIAGGLTPFADRDDISVLRRTEKGNLRLPFDYDTVESGENLDQNILLQNGDVVVVP